MTFASPSRLFVSIVVLAGCADGGDPARTQRAILGGMVDTTHAAVCGIEIQPPATEDDPAPAAIFCTGTLIGTQVVLTSALCVSDTAAGGPLDVGALKVHFGPSFSTSAEEVPVEEIELYRYYGGDSLGANDDVALLRLASQPVGIEPVEVNVDPLPDLVAPVTLVGYGATTAGEPAGKVRYAVAGVEVTSVASRTFVAGTDEATTCRGDGGSPVFLPRADHEVLIGVTPPHGDCTAFATRLRTDRFAEEFFFPYIDRQEGACAADGACTTDGCRTPDPDCDDSGCAWTGGGEDSCGTDCATRDWDCPLGAFVGDACAAAGDCEEHGRCVAAEDDPAFEYCTRPCTEDLDCPNARGMACTDDGEGGKECRYGVPSEGSQGYACTDASTCRSGICEDEICVIECDPEGDACPGDYTCGASDEAPGKNVCLGEDLDGGGGFCAVGASERRGTTGWWLVVLAGLGLAVRLRRRGVAAA
jgi:hypothetical protein